jgi:hypothetical protein
MKAPYSEFLPKETATFVPLRVGLTIQGADR